MVCESDFTCLLKSDFCHFRVLSLAWYIFIILRGHRGEEGGETVGARGG